MVDKRQRHVQAIACLAALTHLVFVAGGATGMPVRGLLAHYAAISGTEGPYGFFAPGVAPELRARFQMEDGSGAVSTDVLETSRTPEADRRFKNIVTKLWLVNARDEERLFTIPWAKCMFARHPSAKTVTVTVEAYDLPRMKAWQMGAKPTWKVRYTERFVQRERRPAHAASGGGPS